MEMVWVESKDVMEPAKKIWICRMRMQMSRDQN